MVNKSMKCPDQQVQAIAAKGQTKAGQQEKQAFTGHPRSFSVKVIRCLPLAFQDTTRYFPGGLFLPFA